MNQIGCGVDRMCVGVFRKFVYDVVPVVVTRPVLYRNDYIDYVTVGAVGGGIQRRAVAMK